MIPGKNKTSVKYQIDALLYGTSEKAYYIFETTVKRKKEHKTNVMRYQKIEVPKMSHLRTITGFDPNKVYAILKARQVGTPSIWEKISHYRADNNYVFFLWDPPQKDTPPSYEFWIHSSESKTDLPEEFNIPLIKASLNKYFSKLTHEEIIELSENLSIDEISTMNEALEHHNRVKLMNSFLSDDDVKMVEAPISEKTPEKAPSEKTPEKAPSEKTPEKAPSEKTPEKAPQEEIPEKAPSKKTPEKAPQEEIPEKAPSKKTPEKAKAPEPPPEPSESEIQVIPPVSDDGIMVPKKNVPLSILQKFEHIGLKQHPLFPTNLHENISILSKFKNMGLHSDFDFFRSHNSLIQHQQAY